jgi:hypothetical protein
MWNELIIKNNNLFEGRMCHSATLYKNNIYVYGGMKNADVTFEDLIILSLDGNTGNFKESIIIIYYFIIFSI